MKTYYTNEENTLILISLLKQHGIKKIIASPGTTNVSFIGSVQTDSYFEIYSAVDERAAAYMACGLAEESGEPVVLSCTGATASRNYIPGLTEAYYKNIPVLAVTSTQHTGRVGHYVAQVIDRSEQYIDLVKASFQIPVISSVEDRESVIISINTALLELKHNGCGPVHINLTTTYSNDFSVKILPDYRKIERITEDNKFPELPNCKIGVYIGSHEVFSDQLIKAIDRFCEVNNAVVLCDHTSNYFGKYGVNKNLIASQNVSIYSKHMDLLIHVGYITGTVNVKADKVWRVNNDGVVRDLFKKLEYIFEMDEITFFDYYSSEINQSNCQAVFLYNKCKNEELEILNKIPDLPFSNVWVAKNTIGKIPEGSVLHLGILNSLRAWCYFPINKVSVFSNVGGFGIDGCASSMIGSAASNSDKQYYGVLGDLSFFYDVNTMLNNIPNNLHLMVINNGVGTEFKIYNHRCSLFGDSADDFMAAKGHNGYKAPGLLKVICQNLNLEYMSASSKEEYLEIYKKWLCGSNKPVVLELFTNDYDESRSIMMMETICEDYKHRVYRAVKQTELFNTFIQSRAGKFLKTIIKR